MSRRTVRFQNEFLGHSSWDLLGHQLFLSQAPRPMASGTRDMCSAAMRNQFVLALAAFGCPMQMQEQVCT
jgi:hypothetical protein